MRRALLASLFICTHVIASPLDPQMQATLSDSVQRFSGIANVNQAAGGNLQQSNARLIAIGKQVDSTLRVDQSQHNPVAIPAEIDSQARVQGHAFSQGNGIIGLNQSAGVANQNINALRITTGSVPESLDDTVLSQSAANATLLTDLASAKGQRIVETSDKAFAGSRGVVQLNQSAGVGNRTANNLSIRVAE